MNYIDYIESSTTWRCPKSGLWKIICVGGGSSGGYVDNGAVSTKSEPMQSEGGATSFGDILTAQGGGKCFGAALISSSSVSTSSIIRGQEGYNLFSYNKGDNNQVFFLKNRHEYGAGGCCRISYELEVNVHLRNAPGMAGQIKVTITDLEQDQSISCSIGAGGKVNDVLTKNALDEYIRSHAEEPLYEYVLEDVQASCTDGTNGVIIVQYLGANI